MPDVELHADFDRDGKLSLTAAEYAARAVGAGAILSANVDRDGRALPATATIGKAVTLDYAMPTKSGGDNDPVPIQIVVSAAAVAQFIALTLQIAGDGAEAIAVIDDHARVVRPVSSSVNSVVYAIPRKAGKHKFRLEAKRVPGSPLKAPAGMFEINILGHDGAGGQPTLDTGRFRVAPFIVMDDLGPAERIYMGTSPDNEPSVKDVTAALAGTGVPLVLFKTLENGGDAWIQDQFQLGYTVTPFRTMRTVLHLPRMRRNTGIDRGKRNLAELVRTHYPSTNLGLIEDFWTRSVDMEHQNGTIPVPFPVTDELFELLNRAFGAHEFLVGTIITFCDKARSIGLLPHPAECAKGFVLPLFTSEARQQLPELSRTATAIGRKLIAKMGAASDEGGIVQDWLQGIRMMMHELDHVFRVESVDRFVITFSAGTFTLDDGQLDDLSDKLSPLHDSLNFGGNIEASPPLVAHPFGKIVVGSTTDRTMDPALLDFLDASSAVQPVVRIDTSWLDVGHVDEVMTFLPDKEEKTHVILRASPEVAQALIDEVHGIYFDGLDFENHAGEYPPWEPPRINRHTMRLGTHPVTRMFRGKYWLHMHPARGRGDVENEPPNIYRRMARYFDGEWTHQNAPYIPQHPVHSEHQYRAAMTTFELNFFKGDTNQKIVDQKLYDLERLLRDEFTEFAILKVPVFFDFAENLEIHPTSAFTPDLVNLQYVNGTVLIPHPFGPRLLPDDAVTVLRNVFNSRNLGSVAKSVSTAFFKAQKLDVVTVWLEGRTDYGGIVDPISNLKEVTAEFIDGFPQTVKREDIEKQIKAANPGAFDFAGRLNKGWRKIKIPEKTVDVFQAYTHALLTSLGLKVQWIDSWFYHVRFGEIHCGTNVLRKVPAVRTPWWTRV